VPERSNEIWNEVASAGRGVAALLIGNRRASSYFDFSQRGLVGSFIAFLAVTLFTTALPLLLGVEGARGSVLRATATVAILFGFQIAFSAILLRQVKRLDGLVPYLVADNWASFFITFASTLLGLLGIGGEFLIVAVGIMVIVIEINIARLIVTLSAWQIAMVLVAQLVGVSIALLLVGVIFPLSPEQLAEISAAASSSPPS
jgi:hypothetical protein